MQKNRNVPTVEEFLNFIPKRSNFEWYTDEENLVRIKVPKFSSNVGKSFCKLIKKDNIFIANLDKLGSVVWNNCNGKKNVNEILRIIKKEFPDQENIDQRLFLFIQQMKNLNYLIY